MEALFCICKCGGGVGSSLVSVCLQQCNFNLLQSFSPFVFVKELQEMPLWKLGRAVPCQRPSRVSIIALVLLASLNQCRSIDFTTMIQPAENLTLSILGLTEVQVICLKMYPLSNALFLIALTGGKGTEQSFLLLQNCCQLKLQQISIIVFLLLCVLRCVPVVLSPAK